MTWFMLHMGSSKITVLSASQIRYARKLKTSSQKQGSSETFKARSWYKAFYMKIIFHSHTNKTNFHMKGCALGFVLTQKLKVFWKWPIRKTCSLFYKIS